MNTAGNTVGPWSLPIPIVCGDVSRDPSVMFCHAHIRVCTAVFIKPHQAYTAMRQLTGETKKSKQERERESETAVG